jgi:uncharacterized protein HemX
MAPDTSPGEVGGIFAGAVALLIALGHGLRWWLGWTDRRAATRAAKLEAWQRELTDRERRFDARQSEYQERIEVQLAELRDRDELRDREIAVLRAEGAAMRTAYQLITSALRRKDPKNPALGQADEILKAAFPPDTATPPDMLRRLGEME